MDFYNVKKRAHVEVKEEKCEKVVYESKTAKGIQKRYALKAVDNDGTKLTRFITEAQYNASKAACAKKSVCCKKKAGK